jgi:hypothetical protein
MNCVSCGAKNDNIVYFCANCGKPIKYINLLEGLSPSGAAPKTFIQLYKIRYDEKRSPFGDFSREDTRSYIFQLKFKNDLLLPVAQNEVNTFSDIADPLLRQQEDLELEFVVIGYLARYAYHLTLPGESVGDLQKTWAKGNLEPSKVIRGLAEHGAAIPWGPHMILYEIANPQILKNLTKYSKISKLVDPTMQKNRLMLLESIGYFLCERDLYLNTAVR